MKAPALRRLGADINKLARKKGTHPKIKAALKGLAAIFRNAAPRESKKR